MPSLDFSDEEVERMASKITREFLARFLST